MFDLWEILKYKVKKACHWLKQSVRQFFCKHHYVEKKYFGMECLVFIMTVLNVLSVARPLKKKIG